MVCNKVILVEFALAKAKGGLGSQLLESLSHAEGERLH